MSQHEPLNGKNKKKGTKSVFAATNVCFVVHIISSLKLCSPQNKRNITYTQRYGVIPSPDGARHAGNICITLLEKTNKTIYQAL